VRGQGILGETEGQIPLCLLFDYWQGQAVIGVIGMSLPFDITAKECEKSCIEGRACMACSFFSQKKIKHTLEEIAKMNQKKELWLAEMRKHD